MSHNFLNGLDVERLESRQMMAGDVTAALSGGDLVVNGDNAGNEVVIRATEQSDRFVIEGLNGTTINGQESAVISGVDDDLRINLRNGDNVLLLTAQGVDDEQASFEIADDLQIRTGGGSDVIMLDNVQIDDQTRVTTGNGDDSLVTYDTQFGGEVRVSMGGGMDAFGMDATLVRGRLRANMGSGNDVFVSFRSQFNDRVELTMGSGEDGVGLAQSEFSDDLRINGGQNSDVVKVYQTSVQGETRLRNLELLEDVESWDVSELIVNHDGVQAAIQLVSSEGTLS